MQYSLLYNESIFIMTDKLGNYHPQCSVAFFISKAFFYKKSFFFSFQYGYS